MSYIDAYLPIGEGFEGRSRTMYLDPEGNVTAAVGLLIANAVAASKLPFVDVYGKPATAQKIMADFTLVSLMKPGYLADYYMFPGASALTDASIDDLLRAKVVQFDADLRSDFPGYDSFPDGVKIALLDMEYNLGDAKLRGTYPHFDAAVDARDWLTAAAQCGRDSSDQAFNSRNSWTKLQFMDALGAVSR